MILSLHSLTLSNVVTIFWLPKYGLLLSATSHHSSATFLKRERGIFFEWQTQNCDRCRIYHFLSSVCHVKYNMEQFCNTSSLQKRTKASSTKYYLHLIFFCLYRAIQTLTMNWNLNKYKEFVWIYLCFKMPYAFSYSIFTFFKLHKIYFPRYEQRRVRAWLIKTVYSLNI